MECVIPKISSLRRAASHIRTQSLPSRVRFHEVGSEKEAKPYNLVKNGSLFLLALQVVTVRVSIRN